MTLDALCKLTGRRFTVQPCRDGAAWRVRIQRAVRDRDGELVITLDAPSFADGVGRTLDDACWWAGIEFAERIRESGRGVA